jgi:L-lysine exporter family protein LysE/ArgO
MFGAYVTGFATGFSLIMAIGAQNAFMLRQGLLRSHVLPLVLLFACSDAILVSAGVAGFGAIVHLVPELPEVFSAAGAVFLTIYGALRFRTAVLGDGALTMETKARALGPTLAAGAAFTWLNPHVYLDTLALMGAVSTHFDGLAAKAAFAAGATTASFVFFCALGYGARLLAPLLQSPQAWRVLDLVIALTMWTIATTLILAMLG